MNDTLLVSVMVLLAWGALAFGSEYSWAYAPLLVLAITVSALATIRSRGVHFPAPTLRIALAATMLIAFVHVLPLPKVAVHTVSPFKDIAGYDQLYQKTTMQAGEPERSAAPQGSDRRISLAPGRTFLGLTFLAAFTVLFLTCTRAISVIRSRSVARGIVMLATLVAVLELAQKASGSDVVYGFWYPPVSKGYHSAPFINRNHTAGWLVMALSLSVGYFAAGVAQGLRGVKPDWRNRILWFSTRSASEILLTACAIAVIAIAIVVTASRSGLFCLFFVILLSSWWAVRRQATRHRRLVTVVSLVVVIVAAAFWGQIDVVLTRYETVPSDVRFRVWQDTLRIIRDFPITGTGLNTYGIAMLHYQTVRDGNVYIEAHNDYLQLAVEGGLLLGIPIVTTIVLFIREVCRRFRERADDTETYWLRAGAVTGLSAIAFQEAVDFTLQMPGAVALFIVLAAIAIHRPRPLTTAISD